jgi:hypothetical protein
MARIELKWDEPKLAMYDHYDVNDIYTALPSTYREADKPLLIYLTSDLTEDAQEVKNIESSALKDESVEIGATMFSTIKMNGNKVNDRHQYWKTIGGKDLPRFVVVDTTGQKVGSVEGKDVSLTKVFGLMKRAAAKTYKTDLDTIVKETKSVLTDLDRVDARRKALDLKKKNEKNANVADLDKEQKSIDEFEKSVQSRDAALKKKWAEDRKLAKN